MDSDEEMTLGTAGKAKTKAKDAKASAKGMAEPSKKRAREEEDDDDDSDADSADDDDDDDSDGDDDEDEDLEGTLVEAEEKAGGTKKSAAAAKAKKATPKKKAAPVKGKKSPVVAKTVGKAKPAAKGAKATPPAKAAKSSATKPAPAKKAKKEEKPKEVEEEDDEDDEDEDLISSRPAGAAASSSAAAAPRRTFKALKPADKLEVAMKAFRWWEAPTLPKGVKWRSMEHAGVCFPPAYKPHGVKMRYEGAEMTLTSEQEELATYYAGIAPDGPQLGNAKTAKVFNKNFWRDFVRLLGPGHVIQKFESCDFEPIRVFHKAVSEAKKLSSKEEKEKAKEEKLVLALKHGFALVDGHLEKMGNYMVEPPGLFRGRGEHPKMGVLKKRIASEDITINVAHMACVPPCPLPGHSWKRVVHDPSVTWLAYWRDPVGDHHKYVFLAASSSFKGRADREKYEKARRLKLSIDKIRGHYEKLLRSEDEFERQSGTAMWIIDRLALRVGGEKDEDEADTVGCCSLRVEHMAFPADNAVTLDFLGKDSMRYFNTISLVRFGDVGAQVWKNLRRFTKHKKADEDIFDMLNPSRLNEQLDSLMPGLSAKVFRTYNASVTLEKELEMLPIDTPIAEKFLEYQRANREVAILCNHQRTVPKAFTVQYAKLEDKAKLLSSQLDELRLLRADLKSMPGKPSAAFTARKSDEEMMKIAEKEAAAAGNVYAAAKSGSAGASAPLDKDKEKELKEACDVKVQLKKVKDEESHRFPKLPTLDQVEARLMALEDKLDTHELNMRDKDENKTVALGTSKINYMDPRITVAWCKLVELPIEKVFAKTLQDKFPWAMGVESTYKF